MSRVKKNANRRAVDFILLISIVMLVFIGIIMVFSASWPEAMSKQQDGYHFLKRQIMWAFVGFGGLFLAMNFDYKKLKKLSPYIFIMSLILGFLVFTPMGESLKGARRWVKLGPVLFMPSDTIKFGAVLFFAKFLTNKREKIGTIFQGTVPALMYIGLACGIIIVQDLGTGVTLAITMMSMFFIAGMKVFHMLPLGGIASTLFYFAVMNPDKPHRLRRITAFRDPFADKLDTGWQVVQSLYALGSGGVFGLGLGKSRQKFFYVSEAYNDFIFAIIGEELGLLGTIIVMLIILIVIWRGIIIALKTEDRFGCLLATGITALIAVQSLIHIAVVTSSIPTTGITLPFVSYGGTSLVMYMTLVGILLNISRHVNFERS
ncbi:MAG: putative lipid II flippase FtsW [Tissierella sp.]|uniref:putative lipid II flippase FtsW n=1 Tax=Tissierella sp. TaxID=41274 RepID=UPI003F944F31